MLTKLKEDQEGFLNAQRLANQAAREIQKCLRVGMTEKQAASLLDTYLKDFGVKSFFHTSFAWFGDRTRFSGMKHYWDFMPSSRILNEDDVVILDTAPIVKGYIADIGHTFALKSHHALEQAHVFLLEMRETIRALFQEKKTRPDIWSAVHTIIQKAGYDNCYQKYPFRVLGHRVSKVRFPSVSGVLVPFSWQALASLLSHGGTEALLSPEKKGKLEGFWAIEPHIGSVGFGAKFEEILYVHGEDVHWIENRKDFK